MKLLERQAGWYCKFRASSTCLTVHVSVNTDISLHNKVFSVLVPKYVLEVFFGFLCRGVGTSGVSIIHHLTMNCMLVQTVMCFHFQIKVTLNAFQKQVCSTYQLCSSSSYAAYFTTSINLSVNRSVSQSIKQSPINRLINQLFNELIIQSVNQVIKHLFNIINYSANQSSNQPII